MDLAEAMALGEQIKTAYRANWDEIRFQNERTGEVSPTQYDVTLGIKGGVDLYFSYRENERGERRWMQRVLATPETTTDDWQSRHERTEAYIELPAMLSQILWDVVTVHGDGAQKRGWSQILRDGVTDDETEPEPEEKRETDERRTYRFGPMARRRSVTDMGSGWKMYG